MAAAVVVVCVGAAPAVGALPDGRGYELASAVDKRGGDVMPMSSRTRVAADGSAVNFTSLVGFGDVHGATIGTEYIAQRTGVPGTSGWVSHGITPAQKALPLLGGIFGTDPAYDNEFSADLSAGVFRAYRPLTDAPDVAGLLNLYVRRDLRTPGAGFYELISDPGFAVATPVTPVLPTMAGASSDFSHVIFETPLNLAADASGSDPKLYEWADGRLRLAGIFPDGSAAPSSQAGRGAFPNPLPAVTPHMISADGSRVFFQAPAGPSGNVYMRVNSTRTVQLNSSEKTVPESPQAGNLWTASADGSRVFFSTSEGLVDGDDDGADDYYMYDVNAPVGQHLTLISRDNEPSVNDSLLGVVGASEDGHYLYFMVAGQLVAGEDPFVFGLYVWHDGVVRFIGSFADGGGVRINQLEATWVLVTTTMVARVSADGSHVMFAATSDGGFRGRGGFTGFDHGSACGGGCRELYEYGFDSGQLRCASCNPFGRLPFGDVQVNTRLEASSSAVSSTSHLNRALSGDGRWGFFNSPDALVADDVNGRVDAYEYDTTTGRVALLSSGRSSEGSYFMDASASGRDVFFVTRDRLVGWDSDDSYDLYDARVGGGLPEPVRPLPTCSGDACQGPAGAVVGAGGAASSAFEGKGDAAGKLHSRHVRHKRCKHGKRRVVRRGRVRCVAKKAHRVHRGVRVSVVGGGGR